MRIGRMIALMEQEAERSVRSNMSGAHTAGRGAPVRSVGALVGKSPFRSLVFTVLSARTKDETTLAACRRLFAFVKGPRDLVELGEEKVGKLIYPVGFYRTKAKNIVKMGRMLVEEHGGKVPRTREGLESLPGVGRKTANIMLCNVFGENEIPVDVHVHRISNRLGLVRSKTPLETEHALHRVVLKRYIRRLNFAMVAFGQTVCRPAVPLCSECPLRKSCPKVGVKSRK